MGRKGGGGGSAGGGRSGKRNNVTYNRVIPRFLQHLISEGDTNPLEAKRGSATHHLGLEKERKECERTSEEGKEKDIQEKEIAKMECEGFNVIVEDATVEERCEGKSKKLKERGQEDKLVGKIKGIQKKENKRGGHMKGNRLFEKKNVKKLSFRGDDSEDSEDEQV